MRSAPHNRLGRFVLDQETIDRTLAQQSSQQRRSGRKSGWSVRIHLGWIALLSILPLVSIGLAVWQFSVADSHRRTANSYLLTIQRLAQENRSLRTQAIVSEVRAEQSEVYRDLWLSSTR